VDHSAPADLSRLHVLVPLRGLAVGKTRLGLALDAEERAALMLGMLLHALATLREWPASRQVHVITDDPEVADVARHAGAAVVAEPVDGDLNAALRAGRHAAVAADASAILFLPADLPLLSRAGLASVLDAADAALAAGSGRPIVVIAPSDARSGTNALLLSPPWIIEPEFGEASLEAHIRAAAAADASLQLVVDPALGFDLDMPDDLERLDSARMLELLDLGSRAVAAPETP
jgi:2-phospho-L-lactate guanylyltransferase